MIFDNLIQFIECISINPNKKEVIVTINFLDLDEEILSCFDSFTQRNNITIGRFLDFDLGSLVFELKTVSRKEFTFSKPVKFYTNSKGELNCNK